MIAAIAFERASRTSRQIRTRCGWAPPQPRSVAVPAWPERFWCSFRFYKQAIPDGFNEVPEQSIGKIMHESFGFGLPDSRGNFGKLL
jgi:hypothetical protein